MLLARRQQNPAAPPANNRQLNLPLRSLPMFRRLRPLRFNHWVLLVALTCSAVAIGLSCISRPARVPDDWTADDLARHLKQKSVIAGAHANVSGGVWLCSEHHLAADP
jgi:hypothetical protein